MAKDLTEALRALTEQSGGQTSRRDKTLPPPRDAVQIPPREGKSGPISSATGGDAWELKGEKTWATTDGLFTLYMPETLKSNIGGKLITIGAIKTEAPE